jgi:CRP-like cAMP-binding protein
MDLNELRERLDQMLLLKEIPEAMREKVLMIFLRVAQQGIMKDGEILFNAGDTEGDLAYVLLQGEVTVEKADSPIIDVPAPDLLGEIKSISTAQRRTATVKVKGKAQLLRFTWSNFNQAAGQLFNAAELDKLNSALEQLAWAHTVD